MALNGLTLADIRKRALGYLDSSDQDNHWGTLLNDWINDGLANMVGAGEGFEQILTLQTVVGVRDYPLPQAFMRPKMVLWKGYQMQYVPLVTQDFFTMGTSGINPVIRALVAAGGFDLSTRKPITRPTNQPGGLTPAQRLYAAENAFMPTKIGLATPLSGLLTGHPLSPLNQNISRYESGNPRLPAVTGEPGVYGGTVPSYLPAWHGLGSYVPQVLGIPQAPRPQTAAQTARYAKTAKTSNKTYLDFLARQAAAAKKGIH